MNVFLHFMCAMPFCLAGLTTLHPPIAMVPLRGAGLVLALFLIALGQAALVYVVHEYRRRGCPAPPFVPAVRNDLP